MTEKERAEELEFIDSEPRVPRHPGKWDGAGVTDTDWSSNNYFRRGGVKSEPVKRHREPGGIYKTQTGIWWYSVTVGGIRKKFSTATKDSQKAAVIAQSARGGTEELREQIRTLRRASGNARLLMLAEKAKMELEQNLKTERLEYKQRGEVTRPIRSARPEGYIYLLHDRKTIGKFGYIGQTVRWESRKFTHLHEHFDGTRELVRRIKERGGVPEVLRLDTVKAGESLDEAERDWYETFRRSGWNLVNRLALWSADEGPEPEQIKFLMFQAATPAEEKHFTPEILGTLWGISMDTVRRLFEKEPGVLIIERSRPHARRYRTMRIPESVAQRVHRRLSNPD